MNTRKRVVAGMALGLMMFGSVWASDAGVTTTGDAAWLQNGLYSATFEGYDSGEAPSSKGVVSGTWQVPTSVEAYATKEGTRTYMSCESAKTSEGLSFLPSATGSRALKSVVMSILLDAFVELPTSEQLGNDARAAFCLHAPEDGEAGFYGWTANGWTNLVASVGEIKPEKGWYQLAIRFVRLSATQARIQYRLKKDGETDFVAMKDATGETWFDARNASGGDDVKSVEFYGVGGVEYVTGGDQKRGLALGVKPARTYPVDETTVKHDMTDQWVVKDDTEGTPLNRPKISGEAYQIETGNKLNEALFVPNSDTADAWGTMTFAVRFDAANDDETIDTNDVALVRVVEDGPAGYRFACLVDGAWQTNTTIAAELDATYTLAVTFDPLTYYIAKRRGGERGRYRALCSGKAAKPEDGLETVFSGNGLLYSIRATGQPIK